MKRIVIRILIILSAVAACHMLDFCFIQVLSAEEIPLTFNEAVAIGLRDNPDVLLKAKDVEIAKLKIAEAQADAFPALSYTGSWFYTAGLYTKDLSQVTSQITLKQYLYKGGKVINNIKYNKYKLEVEESLLDKTKLEAIFNFANAYYTLSLSKSFVGLNKKILENSQQQLDFIRARYQGGQASHTDLLQAEASLSNVKQGYEASLAQQEGALALLNNLLSLDKDVIVNPVTEFKFSPKDIAFDQGFLKAMQLRPEIRQLEAQLKADKSAIAVAKAQGRPSVYASWDYYGKSHVVSTTVARNRNDYNVLGVTFSWPIFDGWQTKAKVQQAIIDLQKTQISKTKLIRDIALDVKNAYLDLVKSLDQINASGADSLFYENNFAAAKEKYAKGQVSLLDRNDAQLKFEISVFNEQQAVYDYIIAKFNFDLATGGFNEI